MQPVQGLRELLPCSAVSFTEQRALLFWLKIEQQDGTHAAAPASLSHHGHFASRMHAIHKKKTHWGGICHHCNVSWLTLTITMLLLAQNM